MLLTGYLNPGFASSLFEFGQPTELPRSGGWFLRRPIANHNAFDGMGCYPIMACQDWSALAADLDAFAGKLISFAAVPDPFGSYSLAELRKAFPTKVSFFKDHYIADLTRRSEEIVSAHHRKQARNALRSLSVEFYSEPLSCLEEWLELFSSSVRRFNITGIRAFSRESLRNQLSLPGAYVSMARFEGHAVSAHFWLVHGDTAYAHLAASMPAARGLSADYALYYEEIRYFAKKVRWLDWGGEAGVAKGIKGSLGSFKMGWSTATRPVYICHRIFDQKQYYNLVAAGRTGETDYFPAYRSGEFT